MGKKFMVVKPTSCCSNYSAIGRTGEATVSDPKGRSVCSHCGSRSSQGPFVFYDYKGARRIIQESRIVWLPDEDEFKNETYDKELTV